VRFRTRVSVLVCTDFFVFLT